MKFISIRTSFANLNRIKHSLNCDFCCQLWKSASKWVSWCVFPLMSSINSSQDLSLLFNFVQIALVLRCIVFSRLRSFFWSILFPRPLIWLYFQTWKSISVVRGKHFQKKINLVNIVVLVSTYLWRKEERKKMCR